MSLPHIHLEQIQQEIAAFFHHGHAADNCQLHVRMGAVENELQEAMKLIEQFKVKEDE